MSSKNISVKLMVLAVMAVLSLMVLPLSALANDGAKVSLKETKSEDGLLQVDVMIEDVTDLYGLEFQIKYDASVLAVKDAVADKEGVQIEPGNFLPTDQGFLVANEAKASEGKITFASTLLNPAVPVSGNGVLAHLTFEPLNDNASTLEFVQMNLVSADMQPISAETEGLSFGSSTGEAGGSMMWIVIGGGILLVIVVVAVGGFMMMGQSKNNSNSQPTRKQTTARSKASA